MRLIEAENTNDYTDLMKDYSDGYITYSPADSSLNPDESVLIFTAEYILHDKTNFFEDKNQDANQDTPIKYELTMNNEKQSWIFSSTREYSKFEISFTDTKGLNFDVRDTKIDYIQDLYVAIVQLPKGCNNTYPYKDVRIEITIPPDHKKSLRERLLSQER